MVSLSSSLMVNDGYLYYDVDLGPVVLCGFLGPTEGNH